MRLEEVTVTRAQAGIRGLYEQVRVLEADAAARPARARRFPKALVLLSAAAIGAASAGISHPSSRTVPVRAAAAVVHLIDEPAERARALPQRAHVARRVPTDVAHVAARVAAPVVHTAAISRPVASSHTVSHSSTAQRPIVAPAVSAHDVPAHDVPAHSVVPAHRALPAQHRPRAFASPVAIGPVVVVAASEEPQPAGTP